MKISGIAFIHNGVSYDYCFEESIRSMLGVCDEVVIVEAESTDTTLERLLAMAVLDERLRIINRPWSPGPLNQAKDIDWTRDLGEDARQAARFPYILYVQGDELIHEKDYETIKGLAATGHAYSNPRYNFWMDPQHLIPHGKVCGHYICRMAPRDAPVSWGCELLEAQHPRPSDVGIYHYGFLRDGTGFRKKSEVMLPNFCGSIDPIVYEVEKDGIKAMRACWPAELDLPFTGTHPALAVPWLQTRGYKL